MSLDRPELVRALMAAAALVLVVGLIGAFTIDPDDETVSATSDTSTTTSTVVSESTTTTVSAAGGNPSETTVAAATSSTARPTPAANVPDPGPTKPPAAGTYMYVLNNSADPSLNGDTERKVEELPAEGGATRRRQTQKDAQGNTSADDVTWAADAIRVTMSRISSSSGGTIECTWQPPLLMAQLPLSIGKTWKTDSTCTTTVAGSQVTIRRVADTKVTGKALDDVGGEKVAAWVIESTSTTTVRSAFYNEDTKATSNVHFAAPRGLITIETGTIESGPRKGTYELKLKNLAPK